MPAPLHGKMTLAQLTSRNPKLIPLFFERDLDFCCGGGLTVGQACLQKGLDPAEFLTEANERLADDSSGPVPSWKDSQLPELIDYILKRFHEGHLRDFEMLAPMMEKTLAAHGEKFPNLHPLTAVCNDIVADIVPHMAKEEQILFPLLLNLAKLEPNEIVFCTPDPTGPIQMMRLEHRQVGLLLDRLVELTHNFTPPETSCATLKGTFALLSKLNREIRLHVHLENNVLFPMAANLSPKHA